LGVNRVFGQKKAEITPARSCFPRYVMAIFSYSSGEGRLLFGEKICCNLAPLQAVVFAALLETVLWLRCS
jgi:hypothetical protein